MDVKQQQLASTEQELVLRALAEMAARPGGDFLEVGSWCGDSTVILAEVVRQHGGRLFCVDWWKGSPETELADIAARADVFAHFWRRIEAAGLQDVVVPIRGRSDVVARVLRPDSFRLVFLDGDHRYQAIARDIAAYAPLVTRDGGILCGHDCEGRISDFDSAFLDEGRDADCHESVHCGVVRAVGEAFESYSVNYSVWSLRATVQSGGWEPTHVMVPDVRHQRQTPPPIIAVCNDYNLLRYGNRVYAVPHGIDTFDVRDERQRNRQDVLSAPTRQELEKLIPAKRPQVPVLVQEGFLGFNIVQYGGRFFSVAQDIGPFDLTTLSPKATATLQRQSRFFVADSFRGARLLAARCRLETAR